MSGKQKITALLICYNEERNIESYLENMAFADEIIVVDSFSTDNTMRLVSKNKNIRIIQRKFVDFSDQKNFAISEASNEWITFFDADERIDDVLKKEIFDTIQNNPKEIAFYIHRRLYFKDKLINFSGFQNDKAIRLFRKSKCRYEEDRYVHERMICNGKIGDLKRKLDHYSFQSLEIYQQKMTLYARLQAKELFEKGLNPNFFHFIIKPKFRFLHHFIIRFGFLDGKAGYYLSKLHGDYVGQRYAFLAELNKNKH